MELKDILLKKDIKFKRKVLLENRGKEVLLYDLHNKWVQGKVSTIKSEDSYIVTMANTNNKIQLLYHDLQQLILLKEEGYFLPLKIIL